MSNIGRLAGVFAVATLLLLSSACSPKKKIVEPEHSFSYEWMTAKMTMDVTAQGVELNNVTGMLRMRRDSTIWISAAAMMGMETVRVLITQDSVVMLNRFDKNYLAEPLEKVSRKWNLPMTLQEGQQRLVGDGHTDHVELSFGPYSAKIKYSDIKWDEPTTFPMKISDKYERLKL